MLASTLYEIVAGSSGAAVIGVDIPLGMLPDRWRAADTVAADQLGPRRGSVFRVPPRAVWMETDFAAANRLCRELTGAGLSRQSWALRPKLLEANAIWERHPRLLFEAHPEVSFRTMAGAPLGHAKKTWTGQAKRRELLAKQASCCRTTWARPVRRRPTTSWTRPRWRGARTGWRPAPP
jgi:predicted RNase H-like nuclease